MDPGSLKRGVLFSRNPHEFALNLVYTFQSPAVNAKRPDDAQPVSKNGPIRAVRVGPQEPTTFITVLLSDLNVKSRLRNSAQSHEAWPGSSHFFSLQSLK